MIRPYYRGVSGALVTFNTAQLQTFENVTWWLQELREYCDPNVLLVLVAHRIDMKRPPAVETEKAREFADKNKMLYVETSLDDFNDFEKTFSSIVRKIHKKSLKETLNASYFIFMCLFYT